MFDALTDRLSSVFDRLSGRGVLSEKDVAEVMREIRVALLEAENDPPVGADGDTPITGKITFQWVQPPAGNTASRGINAQNRPFGP